MKDTLVFDVRHLRDGIFNEHGLDIPASQIDFDLDDVQFVSTIRGNVQLLRHAEADIYVIAEISTDVELQCGKCLDSFETEISASFEVQFTTTKNKDEIESDEIDAGERYYDSDTLDISDDTRKALILQIPIWPTCSHLCEGLCFQCGTNLNEEKCQCEEPEEYENSESEVRSPFANLAQMLESAELEGESKTNIHKENVTENGTSKT